jgi:hypothetical protein
METPRKDTVEDLRNMEVIRSLVESTPVSSSPINREGIY